jgi:hypothetical protein
LGGFWKFLAIFKPAKQLSVFFYWFFLFRFISMLIFGIWVKPGFKERMASNFIYRLFSDISFSVESIRIAASF